MADNLLNTSNFEQARNSLELTGLNAIRRQSKESDGESKKAALQEAAQQFEAIFMQMLLKSMRKAEDVLESDSPFNSESTKFYRDMSDQQMAIELSSNGSLGLTDLIVRQLGGGDDNFTPRTVLRNDGNLEQINRQSSKISANEKSVAMDDMATQPSNPFTLYSSSKAALTSNQNEQNGNDSVTRIPFVPPRNNLDETAKNGQSVNFSTPSFAEPKDFVTALTEPAKIVQEKIGVPFQVVIAQAALETGLGNKNN
ncbi:rod-binding protein [Colwellia sp. MSW7]|uniref:Rod-binding protein n=1 Tax=Colwellia maritima TaxID=2912588 RepID=A0ABS9X364_9GAMM|nr:rod-binding protein [Colwellia maritima]MCI2284626.1 rod-binding protein [Colwellia maritima]